MVGPVPEGQGRFATGGAQRNPWTRSALRQISAPKGRRMKRSVLQIPLVVLDPVCVQQRLQLLHESPLPVVGRLIPDIAPHRLELRRAHSERRVTFLPRSPRTIPPR